MRVAYPPYSILLITNGFCENMTHPTEQNNLLLDIRQLIAHAQQRAAAAVNAELTLLYWQIGKRIQHEVLQGQRAEYGKQMIGKLAEQLTTDYGKGWSEKQLRHCLRLAEVFADEVIFSTVRRKLGWSHIKMLLSLDDPLKRDFYIEIAHLEG